MSESELEKQIAAAQLAAAQLESLEVIKRQAAALPALLEQQRRQAAALEHKQRLDAAIEQARAALAAAADATPTWRDEFARLTAEYPNYGDYPTPQQMAHLAEQRAAIDAHIAALTEIHSPIVAALRVLRPLAGGEMRDIWQRIGGHNPALECRGATRGKRWEEALSKRLLFHPGQKFLNNLTF